MSPAFVNGLRPLSIRKTLIAALGSMPRSDAAFDIYDWTSGELKRSVYPPSLSAIVGPRTDNHSHALRSLQFDAEIPQFRGGHGFRHLNEILLVHVLTLEKAWVKRLIKLSRELRIALGRIRRGQPFLPSAIFGLDRIAAGRLIIPLLPMADKVSFGFDLNAEPNLASVPVPPMVANCCWANCSACFVKASWLAIDDGSNCIPDGRMLRLAQAFATFVQSAPGPAVKFPISPSRFSS